jgi:anti-sigma factor RsiW
MSNVHPIAPQDLSDYLDQSLDPARRSAVDAALAGDPDLRAELADLRAISQALATMPDYTPRRSFRLGDEHRKPTPITAAPSRLVRLMPLVRQFSVAAALIFMVVAGALFLEINGGSDGSSVTNTADQASQTTEDADSEAILTERGDSASAGDEPMDDLTALQANDDQAAGQSTTSLDDHTTWVWWSIGLGVVAVALGGTWYGLARTGRQDGARH